MKAAGIRDLKAQLSKYLRDVAAGEVVLVTDRGRVVAELRPPGTTGLAESPLQRRLRTLADRMPLVIGSPHDAARYPASPVRAAPGTAQALLDEERGE